jgi:hypothetical protein
MAEDPAEAENSPSRPYDFVEGPGQNTSAESGKDVPLLVYGGHNGYLLLG